LPEAPFLLTGSTQPSLAHPFSADRPCPCTMAAGISRPGVCDWWSVGLGSSALDARRGGPRLYPGTPASRWMQEIVAAFAWRPSSLDPGSGGAPRRRRRGGPRRYRRTRASQRRQELVVAGADLVAIPGPRRRGGCRRSRQRGSSTAAAAWQAVGFGSSGRVAAGVSSPVLDTIVDWIFSQV
jgi:hypothetical protein